MNVLSNVIIKYACSTKQGVQPLKAQVIASTSNKQNHLQNDMGFGL